MNLDEIGAEFLRLNVPVFAYGLGRDKNESYCLAVGLDGWHVYYSERGNRTSEDVLLSEWAACSRLLSRLLRDDTVRFGEAALYDCTDDVHRSACSGGAVGVRISALGATGAARVVSTASRSAHASEVLV